MMYSPSQGERRFTLPPPFCSMQALRRLDVAYLHWWKGSFLSLPVQRLISSGKSFADTSTNNISSTIWTSLILVELAQNINHHNLVFLILFFFKWTAIYLCFCWEILVQVWAWFPFSFSLNLKFFFQFFFFFVKIIYCRIFRKYRWGKSHSGNHY